MKKVLTSCLVVLICLTAFLSGYGKGCYSYATNQDGTLTNDELDVAVSSWLQSHGGSLFSPQNYRARKTYEAGLLHNFIYGDCGGYDAIRQHINGGVGGNNELKFDFDGFIIHKLNTWLNRELQNGSFGQGVELNEDGLFDDGLDNVVYSGELFTDLDGNSCLVWIISSNGGETSQATIQAKGSYYRFTTQSVIDKVEQIGNNRNGYYKETLNLTSDKTIDYYVMYNYFSDWGGYYDIHATNGSQSFDVYGYFKYIIESQNINKLGYPIIYHTYANESRYYLGMMQHNYNNGVDWNTKFSSQYFNKSSAGDKLETVNVNFITNNNNNLSVYPTIVDADGHLYITPKVNVGVDGEINYQPYIVNEGDTINNVINQYYIDSNTPDKTISTPSNNPSGGGGGSSDNPSGGNPPNWSNPFPHLSPDGEGGFNFNFQLPDLNIDWNISGLKDKFPFSIPFDLIHFVEVLNAEPETPEFDWTIDLKIYQWHIDADLHEFDNLAGIVRNVEFIGFCITLVLITRRMIKG